MSKINRRLLLQSLAVMPAAALILRPGTALAAPKKIIVFNGTVLVAGGKIEVRAFGWAAETEEGWSGIVLDAGISSAMRDMVGTAAGMTAVVPKGMANTINGFTNKEGVRATTV